MISRRSFLEMALVMGASAAWRSPFAEPSRVQWRERRDIYPEGVASADPDNHSVLLWTRHAPSASERARHLIVEVAEDQAFRQVVARTEAAVSEASDWTCRVLA